jgi:hypothetical protein
MISLSPFQKEMPIPGDEQLSVPIPTRHKDLSSSEIMSRILYRVTCLCLSKEPDWWADPGSFDGQSKAISIVGCVQQPDVLSGCRVFHDSTAAFTSASWVVQSFSHCSPTCRRPTYRATFLVVIPKDTMEPGCNWEQLIEDNDLLSLNLPELSLTSWKINYTLPVLLNCLLMSDVVN